MPQVIEQSPFLFFSTVLLLAPVQGAERPAEQAPPGSPPGGGLSLQQEGGDEVVRPRGGLAVLQGAAVWE